MIKRYLIPCLVLGGCFAQVGVAQQGGSSIQQATQLIEQSRLRAEVHFLASREMKGRNAGSHEDRIAANYIASQFAVLGLKPVGDDASYFQNFQIVRARIDSENTKLEASIGADTKTYLYGVDFNDGWMPQHNTPFNVTAPVVFAGYGIDAPQYHYDDFQGVDVRGKIVLVLSREPQASNPKSVFKGTWDTIYAYNWYKIQQIQKAGAIGILEVAAPSRRPPRLASGPPDYTLPGQLKYGGSLTTDLWDLPGFTITPEVANELLKPSGKTVTDLQNSIDHNFTTDSFEIPNLKVTIQTAYSQEEVLDCRNVAGLLEGSDPQLKSQVVIVSGHYDHGGELDGRIYPGADDNASATVAVIEIARAFVRGNIHPRRSLLFVVFDAEERGLLGSSYYVDHPLIPLADTDAVLNMDMIGRDENTPTWQIPRSQALNSVNLVGTPYVPDLQRTIEAENTETHLYLDYKTDRDDREGWFARSDHFPFATKSVPAILFTTGEQPDYHTENDVWSTLDYPKYTKIVRLVFLTAAEVSDTERRVGFVQ
jgi:hypothetical protein